MTNSAHMGPLLPLILSSQSLLRAERSMYMRSGIAGAMSKRIFCTETESHKICTCKIYFISKFQILLSKCQDEVFHAPSVLRSDLI